ncbi:OsmC family protein, partial [Burkholderia gladioli]
MPLIHAAAELAADAPNYLVDIQAGTHRFQGDEAEREGG